MSNIFKNNHANKRYLERVPIDVTKKEIVRAIENKENIIFFERVSESRSKAYVMLPNDNLVKVVYSRRNKEIVTILPWKGPYSVKFRFTSEKTSLEYDVTLYPDCFLESGNRVILTNIFCVDNGKEITHKDFCFNAVYDECWQHYLTLQGKSNGETSAK